MLMLEVGGGSQICTQQDGYYVTRVRTDEMMMAQGEKDPKQTSQVVLVKKIIMKHDDPVRHDAGMRCVKVLNV